MDPIALWRILQVVLGIGLVIFVHELGHFMAARWCRVRVDVFSLGFGPRLFGWRRGDTLYQVAAVPLGGYVRMAGDDDSGGRGKRDPQALGSKSVGQRFLIYSGGVIMNVVFGLVVFPILFTVGLPLDSPVVTPVPGGPAWKAGLEPGTRVLEVNGDTVHDFVGILMGVAIAPRDETRLRVLEPGADAPREITLTAVRNEARGMYDIGVEQGPDPEFTLSVAKDSPAARAGLRSGDRLLEVVDGWPGAPLLQQLVRALDSGGEPIRLRLERDGEELEVEIVPEARPGNVLVGITPATRTVEALRRSPLTDALDLHAGDVVLAANGQPVVRGGELLELLGRETAPVQLEVERDGRRIVLESPPLDAAQKARLVQDVAFTYDPDSTVVNVVQGSAAGRAGVRDGDDVRLIDGDPVQRWEQVLERSRAAVKQRAALTFTVARGAPRGGPGSSGDGSEPSGDGVGLLVDVVVEPAALEQPHYGFGPARAEYIYKADGIVDAVAFGTAACWRFLQDTWLTLKSMIFRRVSAENIGGPITIAVVSHSMAELGLAKFFFFLCILSINLALINVLPIPLLDGGHLLFLLIEKVKGSPVSERVMSYSQLVGLVLIATLFVYVIFNDIQRVIGRALG